MPAAEPAKDILIELHSKEHPLSAMDHPKYHCFREGFLNAPDWYYLSSSDESEDDDNDDVDGLLTPVSMTRRCEFNNLSHPSHTSSVQLTHDSAKRDSRNTTVNRWQSESCSSSPRRPITRSYGYQCVSLDYRRKGFVICRPALENIPMTFQTYLRYYVRPITFRICFSAYFTRISSDQTETNELIRLYVVEDPFNSADTTFAQG